MRNLNNSYKLFAGFLALVLVAGMTSPAFAGMAVSECIIEPSSASVEINTIDGSDFVGKEVFCLEEIDSVVIFEDTCDPYEVNIFAMDMAFPSYSFTEQVTSFGTIDPQHCIVTFEVTSISGVVLYLEQELWINMAPDKPIGGTVGSLDTASLLVAGAQANMGLWSLALVGIVGAGAAITYKLKSKKDQTKE